MLLRIGNIFNSLFEILRELDLENEIHNWFITDLNTGNDKPHKLRKQLHWNCWEGYGITIPLPGWMPVGDYLVLITALKYQCPQSFSPPFTVSFGPCALCTHSVRRLLARCKNMGGFGGANISCDCSWPTVMPPHVQAINSSSPRVNSSREKRRCLKQIYQQRSRNNRKAETTGKNTQQDRRNNRQAERSV